MFEQHRDDEALERIVRHLRRPLPIDPALDGRVMRQIAAAPVRGRDPVATAWRWLVTPRRVALSPLTGLALAAGLVALLLAHPWRTASRAPAASRPTGFQFVLVAPRAASVSLVGDFNDWDPARAPMRAAREGGVWAAVIPLAPGRYRYAFLVDGSEWLADPGAPRVGDDEFGAPSSVVTVGGT